MFWEYGDKVCRSIEYTAVIRENEHAFPRHTETNPIHSYLFWVVNHQPVLVLSRVCHPTWNTNKHLRILAVTRSPANVCESVNLVAEVR